MGGLEGHLSVTFFLNPLRWTVIPKKCYVRCKHGRTGMSVMNVHFRWGFLMVNIFNFLCE